MAECGSGIQRKNNGLFIDLELESLDPVPIKLGLRGG
jgi:hypothetical protein